MRCSRAKSETIFINQHFTKQKKLLKLIFLRKKCFLFKILTKDSVTVFVNAIMYYKVKNAIHAVANVDDYSGSARLLAATTLRNVLGTMTLGDILCQRESIAREMKVKLTQSITI